MDWLAGTAENDEEHFTATAFLNYFLGTRGLTIPDIAVRPVVVVTFQPYTYRFLLEQTGAERSTFWEADLARPIAHGRFEGQPLSLVQMPVGAPAAVAYLEELAVGGARAVIAVGSAGSLQEFAPVGSAVLPTSALREEGTSYHYQPPEVAATPDTAVVRLLREACAANGVVPHPGRVWTTDAPYRELTSKVRRLAREGIVAVDMEASALFIVGAMRGLQVGSLFIVSDELFHPWRPAFRDPGYRAATERIATAALQAAATLSRSLAAETTSPPS